MNETQKTIGIAGMGAIGNAVAKALTAGIPGYRLKAYSDLHDNATYPDLPNVDFATLCKTCDLIIEALPPPIVPSLLHHVFANNKDVVLISASTLLTDPDLTPLHSATEGRIMIPSGALCGIDGVSSMAQIGIISSNIATTKPPKGYSGAPYIIENNIDLNSIKQATCLFRGNALEAAKGFPANVNVAATLSLAGIGAEKTMVEIWADPNVTSNSHEITVKSAYSSLNAKITNKPDPQNPKTSVLAAQSIIRVLKGMTEPLVVL